MPHFDLEDEFDPPIELDDKQATVLLEEIGAQNAKLAGLIRPTFHSRQTCPGTHAPEHRTPQR